MKKQVVTLNINNENHQVFINPNRTLLHVLREELDLTGTKCGCGEGVCGTCTILTDGRPVRSCMTLAVEAQDKRIVTIEGLQKDGNLTPLQEAFISEGAVQCGFCTPGMILAAKSLLDENPSPTEEEVLRFLSGNLCRCTGYYKIKNAIMRVVKERKSIHGPA